MQNPFEHGLTLANGQHIEAKYMTSIMVALERWHGVEVYDWVVDNIDGAPDELTDQEYWEIADELKSESYISGEDELDAVMTVLREHGYDVKEAE